MYQIISQIKSGIFYQTDFIYKMSANAFMSIKPYPADHDYCLFYPALSCLLVDQITDIGNKMCVLNIRICWVNFAPSSTMDADPALGKHILFVEKLFPANTKY